MSACRTDSRDPSFGGGALLALVHEIGQGSTILYKVANSRIEPLADLHHENADTSEFLEAQGGVESTAAASDVVAFLRRRPLWLRRASPRVRSSTPRPSATAHLALTPRRGGRSREPRALGGCILAITVVVHRDLMAPFGAILMLGMGGLPGRSSADGAACRISPSERAGPRPVLPPPWPCSGVDGLLECASFIHSRRNASFPRR